MKSGDITDVWTRQFLIDLNDPPQEKGDYWEWKNANLV